MRLKGIRHAKHLAKGIKGSAVGDRMVQAQLDILRRGKSAVDSFVTEMGAMLVESLLLIEREQIAGPDYYPAHAEYRKGGSQRGSVYLGQAKVPVHRPRLHGPGGEIQSAVYQKLKDPSDFSEELLNKALHGLSERRYEDTIYDAADSFGISKSSVSKRVVEASTKKLQEFQARDLSKLDLIAIFIDTIHRGGEAFVVALGVDKSGQKHNLGFWEGATENAEVCGEMFKDMERRGLAVHDEIVFVTDGGSGIIKYLKDRLGKRLIHVRCWIHKERNILRHLPKKYRKEAKRLFRFAYECTKYSDAKREFGALVKWLRGINESAANSMLEGLEELLTLHKLGCPDGLRKRLSTTNAIESMFSMVRDCEMNIKRYRSSKMSQRWLATVLLHAEKAFHKRIKGHKEIESLLTRIRFNRGEVGMAAAA